MAVLIDERGYKYEVGRNYEVMQAVKGNKGNYSLGCHYDGFTAEILFKSNNFFDDKEIKVIGRLLYDWDKDIITYRKYIKQEAHEFHKTQSLGLNWDILSHLTPRDYIRIVVDTGKSKIVHTMSVRKALGYQDFKQFKSQGYEKQLFIPIDDFKKKEVTEKKKRGRKGARVKKKSNP